MNDSNVLKASKENPNQSKGSKRRSLSSIQPISTDNKVLTRSMATTTKRSDKDKVKDKNERITKWLTQKDSIETDVKYWKTLAKERQKALDIVLKENRQLSEQLEESIHENQLLTEENKHLSQLAEEGIKLKQMVDQCLNE